MTSTSPCDRAGKPTRTQCIIHLGRRERRINDTLFKWTQANAESNTVGGRHCSCNVAQIRRLQEAGARHIVVPNLPDHQRDPFRRQLVSGSARQR